MKKTIIFSLLILSVISFVFLLKTMYPKPELNIQSNPEITPNDVAEVVVKKEELVSDSVMDLTNQQSVSVVMKDMKFVPEKIKVTKGTTVTWTNEDDMEHNAMQAHDESEEPHDVIVTPDPEIFEGPLLKKGESYSFTFNELSTYLYHCAPHPWMEGVVEVVN